MRMTVNALAGSLLDKGTYHPGSSPGGSFRFLADNRNNSSPTPVKIDIGTRWIVLASPGAKLDKGTYHPGASPGGFFQFLVDIRSQSAPTSMSSDIRTRLVVGQFISMGAMIPGITLPGNYPKGDPSFRFPVKSFDAPTLLSADISTRFVVSSTALTGIMSPYLFVGRLGRSDSQLGNIQLGIDRTFYVGALESLAGSLNDTHLSADELLVLQPRPFNLTAQARLQGGASFYGSAIYGQSSYGSTASMAVQPRKFVIVVQSINQGI